MPELRRLIIAGDPQAWSEAGFTVHGDQTVIGSVAVRLLPETEPSDGVSRVRGWELAGLADPSIADVDGIATEAVDDPTPQPVSHPNGVVRVDHVVIRTPDLARTIGALEAAGFEVRRHRDVPGTSPTIRQVFLWAGEPILEVVGPAEADPDADDPDADDPDAADPVPAAIWGLALTSEDLDGAADLLGARMTTPRAAVQSGRRIAAIDTDNLAIGTTLALMSPHVGRSHPNAGGQ